MKQRAATFGAVLGGVLALAGTLEAQYVDTFSARLQGARSQGGALLPSARLLEKGAWEASWSYGHEGTVAKLDVATGEIRGPGRSRRIDWLGARDYAYLQVAAGLTPQLELVAGLPVLLHQNVQSADSIGAPRAGSAAMGDMDLALRYALFSSAEGRVAWSAQTGLLVPTGSAAAAFGDPRARFRIASTVDVNVGAGFLVRAHAGYQTGGVQRVGDHIFGDAVLAGLGGVYRHGPYQAHLEAITHGVVAGAEQVGAKDRVGMELLLGGRYRREVFFVDAAAGYAVVEQGLTPAYRIMLSAGLHGSLLKKPAGTPSRVASDLDHDGIVDEQDACPARAEDFDGFEDEDGCPELDNDQDGVLDARDMCPMRAEDLDGIQDEDGCPEDDADADGILDTADGCPLAAEDYDGFEDADGCPEAGSPDPRASYRAAALESFAVHFKSNSGVLDELATHVLRDVAALLKRAEGVVLLVGHADERGTDELNRELSLKRAETVRARLVEAGVAPDRLEVRGAGRHAPTAPGASDFGNSMNRRVSFEWQTGEAR